MIGQTCQRKYYTSYNELLSVVSRVKKSQLVVRLRGSPEKLPLQFHYSENLNDRVDYANRKSKL